MEKTDNKCDCLILNFWSCTNYGASLTSYGVQCLIEKLGYKPMIIDYRPKIDLPYNNSFAQAFSDKYLKLTHRIKNYNDFYELNNYTNTFIVGSDQVWNFKIMRTHHSEVSSNIYMLDFVLNTKKKISFSASFGESNIFNDNKNRQYKDTFNYFIKQFDDISVREDDGVNILQDVCNTEAVQLIDGAFYIPKTKLNEMTKSYSDDEKKYIGCYVLPYYIKKQWYKEALQQVSQKLNLPIKYLNFNINTSVEEWLAFIKNSEFIITDSYHAVVLSIIFNKPILQIKNAKTQSRFDSLYRLLNIKNVTIGEDDNISKLSIKTDFDWEYINNKIDEEKLKAENWLKQAFEKQKVTKYNSDTDYFNQIVSRLYINEEFSNKYIKLLANKNKIYRNYYKYKILSAITFGENKRNNQEEKDFYKSQIKELRKLK